MPSNEVVLSTKPLDLDEDKEFRRIWREVQDCFQGIRPIEGFDFKRDENLDPAAIHKLLDNSPDNAEKTRKKDRGRSSHTFNSTKKAEALLIGRNTAAESKLNLLQAVGAPANLCYNALSFVITVYQSYAGMLASLADLLGRFVGFFGRLDNYREAPMLDWKLKRVAMKQLHLFVKICRHTLRLRRHRSFKAEAVMKTLFFKDDKTKLLLQEMEELERQESGIIWTSTLVIATQLQAALHDLRTNLKADLTETFGNLITQKSIGEEGESKEIEMKRRKKTLIEVLMWPPEDLIVGTNGKMPNYIWESSWHRYTAREAVEGTGRWLQSCKVFRDWVEGKTSDTPVLGIEGAEGAGKTQLAANIITRLREMHGKSSPIAYYFLESDSKAGAASKTGVRAAVTRSLIWQLAESYSPFLKSASDICAKHRAIYDPLDMWKYTLVDNTERVRWSTTFFIILDGLVGDGHAKFLRELLPLLRKSSIGDHRIRVLLTGTSKWFSEIKKEKDLGLKTIKLGKDNIEDVESYINQRMNQMDLLQNLSNINVSEMRQKIIDTLKKVTGGDYRKIDTVLTEISEKDDNLQVETCLEQAETAPADQMITTIQRINLRSSPDEISDMNEMIIWVLYGRSRLTPPQLEVALSLKDGPSTKPAPDGERRTIVRSLGSRIRMERYPLFKLTSADEEIVVSFVGDTNIEDAKEHILDVSERNDDGEFQQFHQTEVRMIEHYLKTVCPGDVYDKFGFREFLSKKLSQTRISLSSGNAEITLALRCLQCLVERSTENIVLLHPYAADHLYSHLHRAEYTGDSQNGPKRNGHLSLTDKELRMRVGVLLIKLLSTQDAMNSLFGIRQPFGGESQSVLAQRSLPSSWKSWMQDDKGLELLKIYFRDPAILESIKNDKSDFEKSITCGDSVMTLLKVAIQMASNLLRQADSMPREIENAFAFLLAAYRKKIAFGTLRFVA
ncbi:neutral amino acid permease [Colletotrichum sp. SAR 10_86]|nr:neutral amino acid permease [Colletotrichum sp. SAR 10_76]KAI8221374.1 neutral amino acid permease [Colletotrichum sp. SAR 10_86]KAI8239960.1 neutral amino acid permease [Colletotrichum sp. SAR 10_77]KAJ4998632.1 neutral amino acid permease [Colletotrichum sp. SAR 10_66]